MQGQAANATASADYGQAHGTTGLNITRTSIQSQPISFSASGAVPTGTVDQQPPQSTSISSTLADLSSQMRSLVLNMQGENNAPSGITIYTPIEYACPLVFCILTYTYM